ncbi:MAG: septum formation inhibitor Maf [Flavobacteriaceae bacterium]
MPEAKPVSVITTEENPKQPLNEEFKKYWYAGDAEITSYTLEQARYGELREGHAVLVFVTEPFLPGKQVKADGNDASNIPVLKLNSTKKYLTGIYPYSIMSSTFYPVHNDQHAIKVSNSIQEWCGHVYSQINNREQFEFTSHSYFEGEADKDEILNKNVLENEIWNQLRVAPESLPIGNLELIPSLEFIRTAHIPLKAYKAKASLSETSDLSTYTLEYQDFNRILSITYSTAFPHTIEKWTETFKSGFGPNARELVSKAKIKKRIKTPYWRLNKNKDLIYRDSLGL